MAICIKGHYGTRDKADKHARFTNRLKEELREYSKDLKRGVVHKKRSQKETIRELQGVGMGDRLKREAE